jgi:hypothetical protein
MHYLEKQDILAHRTTQEPHYGRDADGYGRRIPTRYMVKLQDKRWRRVYACQISNAGTVYVEVKGDWHVIRDYGDVADMLQGK